MRYKIFIYLAVQLIIASLYYLSSWLAIGPPIELSPLPIDLLIRPNAWAVWLYLSYFPIIGFALISTPKKKTKELARILVTTAMLSAICFIFFPTIIKTGNYFNHPMESISYKTLLLIKRNDTPLNCAPSLHISNSIIAILYITHEKGLGAKLFWGCWLVLIAWSVLSLKQHLFYDVLGGIGLAFLSIRINSLLFRPTLNTQNSN